MIYDIIVIGGGPAGLTAAVYARRANKTVLVMEKGTFGGQITSSPKVENIPGYSLYILYHRKSIQIITNQSKRPIERSQRGF